MNATQTASEKLAAAHAVMTPAEIADHACAMAELVASQRNLIESQQKTNRAIASALRSSHEALRRLQVSVRQVQSFATGHQKRAAREMLAELAAAPLAEPYVIDEDAFRAPTFEDTVFNPAGGA